MSLDEKNNYGLNTDWLESGKGTKLSIFGGDNRALTLYDKINAGYERIDECAQQHGTTVKKEALYFATYWVSMKFLVGASAWYSTESVSTGVSTGLASGAVTTPAYPFLRAAMGVIGKRFSPEQQKEHSRKLERIILDEDLKHAKTGNQHHQ